MKVAIYNFNGIFDQLVRKVGYKDLVQNWQEADVVVLWQDVIGQLEDIAHQAKNAGKKVIVAEHGFLSINDYIPPLSKPLVADKIMVWGKHTKEWLIEKAHMDPDRIVVTGTLITEKVIPKRKHDEKRILFAPRHWNGEIEENLEVASELKECKYTVFSKLIDGENDPANYPHPTTTGRQDLNHIETCFQCLSWADVVVGIGESTFGALAHLMDIPYISVDNWRDKPLLGKLYTRHEFNSQISKAALQVPLEMLNEEIDRVIKNPKIGARNRKWFRKECLNYPGTPLENMLKVIYE